MNAPSSYTIEHDIKGEPRKFRYGSKQLRDFRNRRRLAAVLPAMDIGAKKVAERIGCCVRSVREWTKKWRRGGEAALEEKSRRPKNPPALKREKIEAILAIRDRQGYGCSKIAWDVGCSSSTVHKYLKVHQRKMTSKPRTRFRRFERTHANTLWQMDYTPLGNGLWVLQVVDDHSRFIVGARTMTSPNVNETIGLLERCFSLYGVPEQFLTDHGTQFYNVRGGVSDFDRFCLTVMVQHILGSIAHPQTLGKTEQRHNMLKDYLDQHLDLVDKATEAEVEEAIDAFVRRHNFDSPHEGWITYRLGDWVKTVKIHFLPFMRFANHRG